MGVLVKHLKQLKDGRWQYRRVWPRDVREAAKDLSLEVKKTFPTGANRDAAIRWTLEQDRKADALIAKARSGAIENEQTEATYEAVAKWFHENRDRLDEVALSYAGEDEHGDLIEVDETERDFERERILLAATKREGESPRGGPRSLTLEEQLKLDALNLDSPPVIRMTISRAFEFYVERNLGGRWNKATEAARQQILEFLGDISLERLTVRMASDWTYYLAHKRSQKAATIQKRVGTVKAVINFAKKHGRYSGENPFSRLQPPKQAAPSLERLPFHKRHIEAIAKHLEGSRIRQETRDLVDLLLLTGCRPSEIGGLKVDDLSLDSEIPYMLVRWTPDKRLKTTQSRRRVPLLGRALEAARRASERQRSGWLFPSVAPKSGAANDNPSMSARINKLIRAAGVTKTPKLVAYSFRHTMAEALDRAGVSQVVRDRVLGKQKADQYGAKELPLGEAKAALEAAIPILGHIDEVEYSQDELSVTTDLV